MKMHEEDGSSTVKEIFRKRLDELQSEKQQLSKQKNVASDLLESLQENDTHPRCNSIIPLSNLLYIDATLHNTEYLLQYSDYKVIASQKQTFNYIENLADDYRSKLKVCDSEIEQIEERLRYMDEFNVTGREITKTEHGYTINHEGFTEIIEFEDAPVKKERVARFKNAQERDEYLKKCKK